MRLQILSQLHPQPSWFSSGSGRFHLGIVFFASFHVRYSWKTTRNWLVPITSLERNCFSFPHMHWHFSRFISHTQKYILCIMGWILLFPFGGRRILLLIIEVLLSQKAGEVIPASSPLQKSPFCVAFNPCLSLTYLTQPLALPLWCSKGAARGRGYGKNIPRGPPTLFFWG